MGNQKALFHYYKALMLSESGINSRTDTVYFAGFFCILYLI